MNKSTKNNKSFSNKFTNVTDLLTQALRSQKWSSTSFSIELVHTLDVHILESFSPCCIDDVSHSKSFINHLEFEMRAVENPNSHSVSVKLGWGKEETNKERKAKRSRYLWRTKIYSHSM